MPLVRKLKLSKIYFGRTCQKSRTSAEGSKMALYRFFTKQVPEVPSPYGSLSSSISPAAIKDANTAVKQCADLSSQAAAKPRGTYAKFTPENQAAIAKYDARSMVLGYLPNSPCVQQNVRPVKLAVALKWPARACPGNFRKFKFRNFILREISNVCENLHQRKFPAIRYVVI